MHCVPRRSPVQAVAGSRWLLHMPSDHTLDLQGVIHYAVCSSPILWLWWVAHSFSFYQSMLLPLPCFISSSCPTMITW